MSHKDSERSHVKVRVSWSKYILGIILDTVKLNISKIHLNNYQPEFCIFIKMK